MELIKNNLIFAQLAWTEFETQSQNFFLRLCVFENYRKMRLSLKLGLNFLLIYSNTQSPYSFSQLFLQKRHCYCYKSFQLKFSFSTDPEPIHIHHSRLTNIVSFFLFGLLFFAVKLKYTNSRVNCSYCRDENVADQCVSRRTNPKHFNCRGLRHLCRVQIFCRRDNKSL
jgi:hypothetical protein